MLVAPRSGFVFIAVTKSASTAIEAGFRSFAEISLDRNPFKHAPYSDFQRYVQPLVESRGFSRSDYEVLCTFRDPIEWLSSWWRYRSRRRLKRSGDPAYTGELDFDAFARDYIAVHRGDRPPGEMPHIARLPLPRGYVTPLEGQPGIDRIYRYENLDALVTLLCEKVGRTVDLEERNVSPDRTGSLEPATQRALRALFAEEYRIYEGALSGP